LLLLFTQGFLFRIHLKHKELLLNYISYNISRPFPTLIKGDIWMVIKGVLLDFGGTIALGDLNTKEFESNLCDYIRSLGFSGTESRFKKARRGIFERLMKVRNQNREIRLEDLYQGLFF